MPLKSLVLRYRSLFWLVGALLIGLGVWRWSSEASASFGEVHTQLLERVHARGWWGDNANLYFKCLVIERACTDWYWD